MDVKTVLLDVDGTLLDSGELVFAGFEHALGEVGWEVPGREELARWIGPPLEQIYAERVGRDRVDTLTRRHRSFQQGNLELAAPFEGAGRALERMRSRGLRLAAVTSRSKLTSIGSLARAGLIDLLEVVISAEDAPALKPDPRHLRAALIALDVPDHGVAMVGDTPPDIEGGRNLGAMTVGALYGFHGAELRAARPDRVIESIAELPDVLA